MTNFDNCGNYRKTETPPNRLNPYEIKMILYSFTQKHTQ